MNSLRIRRQPHKLVNTSPKPITQLQRLLLNHDSRTLSPVPIGIHPSPRLATKMPINNKLRLQHAGTQKSRAIQCLPHRACRRHVHILADEVGQLQRTHAKAAKIAHRAIDDSRPSDAILKNPERFQVVGPRNVVDNKPRDVRSPGHDLTPPLCDRRGPIDDPRLRPFTRNNLDELHKRRRVEEVHANRAMSLTDGLAQPAHRQRRCVRGNDRIVRQPLNNLGQHSSLGIEILDHSLDNKATRAQVRRGSRRPQPRCRRIRLAARQSPLLHEPIETPPDPINRGLNSRLVDIQELDRPPTGRSNLRNAGAHRPGAEDEKRAISHQGREDGDDHLA